VVMRADAARDRRRVVHPQRAAAGQPDQHVGAVLVRLLAAQRAGAPYLDHPARLGAGQRIGVRPGSVHCGQMDLDGLAAAGDAAQGGGQGLGGVQHQHVAGPQDRRQRGGHPVLDATWAGDHQPHRVPRQPARLGRGHRDQRVRQFEGRGAHVSVTAVPASWPAV
jgi:hypothetical protein